MARGRSLTRLDVKDHRGWKSELRPHRQLQGPTGCRCKPTNTHLNTLRSRIPNPPPPWESIPARAVNIRASAFCSSSPCRLARKYPVLSCLLILSSSVHFSFSCPYQTPLNKSILTSNKQQKPRNWLIKPQNLFNDLRCRLKARHDLNASHCQTYIFGFVDTHLQLMMRFPKRRT